MPPAYPLKGESMTDQNQPDATTTTVFLRGVERKLWTEFRVAALRCGMTPAELLNLTLAQWLKSRSMK